METAESMVSQSLLLARKNSVSLKMQEIHQLPRCQSSAPQSARHHFQDRDDGSLDQAGYTLHQGRRLKEFQIRSLERKFFYLWAKKTFGQVLPSKARCFYDQKIIQKTFGEWKEWWSVCRERKLTLRAASHHRLLLYSLIFKAWRAYVCQQQGKRNKYYIAEAHAKKQTLLRTWQCWLAYVDVQRTKRGMRSVALAVRERSCLRISWAMWRKQHYQNCTGRKMNVLALQHWAQSLQFRAWLQWRELYLRRQNDKQKETRAVAHHQHQLLKRCMDAWLGQLNLHRAKKHQNELAREHHRSRMVWQCFSEWRLSWECRRKLHAHQKDIEKQAARVALQRTFAHWKHYVVLCVEETRQGELAEKHYNRHLLKLGFKGLWQNVMNAHLQQMRKNLSYRQHQVTVLQKFWNRWKSRLEEKEEEQQQALTSVAHARYRRVLMKQVFDTWLLKACKQQEYRMGEKRAVLHFERQLLRCSWCLWRRKTAVRLEEQESLVRARDHYSNLLLLKAFCLWKKNTQERETERLKEMQASRFHYSKCLQQSWNKWREYVDHQREKWRKLVQADVHYQQTLLGKTLAAWKSYQHNVQCILYQVAEKEQQHMRLLLRQVLCMWRENALALRCEAKATTCAEEHYRRAILSKVLLQWRCAASLQGYYRQQKMTAVMEARKHLETVHLQTLFLHWKKLTWESLVLRAQQHRAVQHHQQHLLQKYLVKWKKYHQRCLGKMLLRRKGEQLMTHRLCSASFSCWKARLLQQRWEQRKTVQALWHWSLSLQRKVFDAWLRFTKGQRQKKDHTEKAAGVDHTASLREGVTPVWKSTSDMKQLGEQLQAQRQLQKQVTCKMPDVRPETRGHSAEEEPWLSKCSYLPFQLADGDSVLSDLNAIRRARLPPRRPDFLLESLESKELLASPFTRSEVPFQQTSVNKCSVQTGSLMPMPQREESTCKCLPQTGNATHPYPSLIRAALLSAPPHSAHRAVQRPELQSPLSFVPQMEVGVEMRGAQRVSSHKGAHSQDPQQDSLEKKLQPNLQPHFASRDDSLRKWSRQTAAEGEEREHSSREEMVLERRLEGELRHIQQQMQYYFSRKQELKSCQQQAQILQKWLETSTQAEDEDSVQGVQEELDQLQVRINTLTKAQLKERQHVQNLLARLRDIQIALDI
ncbi:SFI1-like protein isoform D [Patagioenas fasciata monilis]|uniref:SFI1-like protein isoform D n=1 Tax=Patagioenas fasciata monilis TaxID=372326 RepID=A0A1V4JRP3_PATFA|nr:SFI1-like protein isoform D [Patagioenas fasciata monilis]